MIKDNRLSSFKTYWNRSSIYQTKFNQIRHESKESIGNRGLVVMINFIKKTFKISNLMIFYEQRF
jgi:hypothetical protein